MKATLFKEVNYTVNKLIDDVDLGEIGLPDIQRPFVWSNTKVRDLFDSMFRGFPVGHLLFRAAASAVVPLARPPAGAWTVQIALKRRVAVPGSRARSS